MFDTAWNDGHRVLYHWQDYNEERLRNTLVSRTLYCSSPSAFNDPWDCKPYFNTELLTDSVENAKHIQWAVDLCRRKTTMVDADIDNMQRTLLADPAQAAAFIVKISEDLFPQIDQRYRVYSLCPDVGNLLMWSHYANDHKGICLEFSLRSKVMCAALRCRYLSEFPVMKAYSHTDSDSLLLLLAKAKAWAYEMEYRLIAQERSAAISGSDTLLTDNNFLQLDDAALTAVIVGCRGDFESIKALVQTTASTLQVKRAVRVPNRYELRIEG
jgi:Protein of unknown function (DUF2971)